MAANRIKINRAAIVALLHEGGVQAEVQRVTREIDANMTALGSQTRVDFSQTSERPRGAVIGGYEDGATVEGTRAKLLRATHFQAGGSSSG